MLGKPSVALPATDCLTAHVDVVCLFFYFLQFTSYKYRDIAGQNTGGCPIDSFSRTDRYPDNRKGADFEISIFSERLRTARTSRH